MKIDRLIGILSVLLQREKVTAPELAETFEVSRRTINRDIENLCKAGIPISTSQGTAAVRSLDRVREIEPYLFEHEYTDKEGLIAWMLSCRDKVMVLEPESVRAELLSITFEIVKRYAALK